jgi:hypothetical protein
MQDGWVSRVTRLGEFSPIGRLFTLKIAEVAHIFWATRFHGTSIVLNLMKNSWATFWATFFKNTSGHPGRETFVCTFAETGA